MKCFIWLLILLLTASTRIFGALPDWKALDALSLPELEARLPGEHPYAYFGYAGKLLKQKKLPEALRWYYIAQLRGIFYLQAHPELDPQEELDALSVLKDQFGEVLNQYAAEHPDIWIREVKAALAWDADYPNSFTSESQYKDIYAKVRSGYEDLERQIETNQKKYRAIARGEDSMPDGWPTLKAITSATDLAGIYQVGRDPNSWPILQQFNLWPWIRSSQTIQIYPLTSNRILVVARAALREIARGESTISVVRGGARLERQIAPGAERDDHEPLQIWINIQGSLVARDLYHYRDVAGLHTRGTWAKIDPVPGGRAAAVVPGPPPDLDPAGAILAAGAGSARISDVLRLTVRSVGTQHDWLYLDSEEDYRNPSCLVVAIAPELRQAFLDLLPDHSAKSLVGGVIRVEGIAQKVKIWRDSNHQSGDDFYYQTHVRIGSLRSIQILPGER